jgi:hypothetical protein
MMRSTSDHTCDRIAELEGSESHPAIRAGSDEPDSQNFNVSQLRLDRVNPARPMRIEKKMGDT